MGERGEGDGRMGRQARKIPKGIMPRISLSDSLLLLNKTLLPNLHISSCCPLLLCPLHPSCYYIRTQRVASDGQTAGNYWWHPRILCANWRCCQNEFFNLPIANSNNLLLQGEWIESIKEWDVEYDRVPEVHAFIVIWFAVDHLRILGKGRRKIWADSEISVEQDWKDGTHFFFQKDSVFEPNEICCIVNKKSNDLVFAPNHLLWSLAIPENTSAHFLS